MTAIRPDRDAMQRRSAAAKPDASARGAFTLVEVLVVTAILALLVGVIGACLAGGFRVWDSARTCNEVDGRAMIAMAIFERDLMNSLIFHEIEFKGDSGQLAFAGLVPCAPEPAPADPARDAGPAERLGTIQYAFDPVERSLTRSSQAFPPGEASARSAETLLAGVRSVRFRYRAAPGGGSPAGGGSAPPEEWREEWSSPTNAPGLVRVDFAFGDERHVFEIGRTVVLPLCASSGGGAR